MKISSNLLPNKTAYRSRRSASIDKETTLTDMLKESEEKINKQHITTGFKCRQLSFEEEYFIPIL